MPRSALYDKFVSLGAPETEFAGTETAASFGAPAEELTALREGCAVYDLSWRGMLILTGDDRVRWLNGMVTNNVRDLALNHGNYSFVLNPQGRIQGDLTAYNRGEYILVTSEMSQLPRLKEIFDRYIIMDDVEVADVSEKLMAIGVAGPQSRKALGDAGFVFPELGHGEVLDADWNGFGLSIARGVHEQVHSYEIWFHPDNAAKVWDALVAAGARPTGTQAIEWQRILNGIPRYGIDIVERDLPQETEQMRALHFNKGCYIGQEIVERIRSRGAVHRTLAGFIFSGEAPAKGTKIVAGEKEVGELGSAATIPVAAATHTVGLGIVRREAATPGNEVRIGEATAKVASLPFQF